MKTIVKQITTWLMIIFIFPSCGKDEFKPYYTPFIRIMKKELNSVTVSEAGNLIDEYLICLSSAPLSTPLEVTYSIEVGDGLTAGVDYELLTSGNKVVFPTGVYDMPIRVRWIANPIDVTKNNTMTITLVSTSNPDVVIGMPGPDHFQRQMVITKVKAND